LRSVELLTPEEWPTAIKYGLTCAMGSGADQIHIGFNRTENHDTRIANLTRHIELAAEAGIPNIICFSGNRNGMSDEEGLENCVLGLKRVVGLAEKKQVTICMELLNSKVNHKDYMCDHTAWGVQVVQAVNSPNVKLLYDIYHMQIMEGDLVKTIQDNIQWIAHFHTGGVPGRHELDGTQEVQWDGVMRGIVATNFNGYVAHEFVPTRDPFTSLREAVDLCDV